MTEYDPLELELAALRPHEPSEDLKRRIADDLTDSSPIRRGLQFAIWRRATVAGGLLAASLLAVMAWRGDRRTVQVSPSPEAIEPDLISTFDRSLPSVWSYRQALNRSTESFDGLLDAHLRRAFQVKGDALPLMRLASFTVDKRWINEGEL